MGVVKNIGHNKYPKQSKYLGSEVNITFNYDHYASKTGIVIRDDTEEPFRTIFKLENGNIILATECQYMFKNLKKI